MPRDYLEGVDAEFVRSTELPDWESGTDVHGYGDRVWTQGGDMVAGFFAGESAGDDD